MSRKKPRNKGKPPKTEPSAMQHISQNDKTNNPHPQKAEEIE